MTGNASLAARAVLGLVSVGTCCGLISSTRLQTISRASFDRLLNWAMVGSRLGIYTLLYFVLRLHPRGDILLAYTPEAFATFNGLLVYRDFPSSYAPLHTFLDSAFFHFWPSPLALIFFAVCMELLLLPVWFKAGRNFLSEKTIRTAALLYLASPLSLQFVAVDGQDNVVVALLLALALLLLISSRPALSGFLFSASICLFKFLPLIFVPSYFLSVGKGKWKWIVALALPTALVYGAFVVLHAPILVPLLREGALRKAGCLPYLCETLLGRELPTRMWDAGVPVALLVVLFLVVRQMQAATEAGRFRILTDSMPCFLFVLVVFAKKSWPPYLLMALLPICVIVSDFKPWKRFVFLAFSFLALMEHSFWSIRLHEVDAIQLHQQVVQHNGPAIQLLVIEIFLISGYLWLLIESVKHLLSGTADQKQVNELPEMNASLAS